MKLNQEVGITAYGVSLPSLAVSFGEIASANGKDDGVLACPSGIKQKTVPEQDEDAATLAAAAGQQALLRWQGDVEQIGGIFVGSESHPYAVNPTGTMVKTALGLSNQLALADLQFACKAGTQGLQIGLSYVAAGMAKNILAIGADTAQAEPGDALEFAAGAGAAALLVGKENLLARVLGTTSYATDTTDFWRRPGQSYPQHAGRFTGGPAYFHHVGAAATQLMTELNLTPADIDYAVFHTPNAKFPLQVAQKLGFTKNQVEPSLVVREIGNTYAAASLIALSSVLDQAEANQTILLTSYGSGAGADSFLLETTPLLVKQRQHWHSLVKDQVGLLQPVSYQVYRRNTSHVQ
jgi:hydroxymethylglutaryl-CoA synthase